MIILFFFFWVLSHAWSIRTDMCHVVHLYSINRPHVVFYRFFLLHPGSFERFKAKSAPDVSPFKAAKIIKSFDFGFLINHTFSLALANVNPTVFSIFSKVGNLFCRSSCIWWSLIYKRYHIIFQLFWHILQLTIVVQIKEAFFGSWFLAIIV